MRVQVPPEAQINGDKMITQIHAPVIWFDFMGDEVCWNGSKYLSLLSGGSFASLEEVESFWKDYYNALSEDRYYVVTREMALDAGDPSLEGQIIHH